MWSDGLHPKLAHAISQAIADEWFRQENQMENYLQNLEYDLDNRCLNCQHGKSRDNDCDVWRYRECVRYVRDSGTHSLYSPTILPAEPPKSEPPKPAPTGDGEAALIQRVQEKIKNGAQTGKGKSNGQNVLPM